MEYELYHHGTKGMKWGVRRYQNPDGSLTAAGRKRYGTKANFEKVQRAKKAAAKVSSPAAKARAKANARTEEEVKKYLEKAGKKKVDTNEAKKPEVEEKVNKALGKSEESKKTKTEVSAISIESVKKKSVKDMTDEELKAEIDRLDLESRYRKALNDSMAATQTKKETSKGKKFVKDIFESAGKNIGQQVVVYAMGTVVNKTLGELFGDPKMVNPKKGQKDK